MKINSFDIDGVIFMGYDHLGVYPGPKDVIITGRSLEELPETKQMLLDRNILNTVYFNPIPFDKKTRVSSGIHKAFTLTYLQDMGYIIGIHFEDDPIQAEVIRDSHPEIHVVMLQHNLMTMENVRHIYRTGKN